MNVLEGRRTIRVPASTANLGAGFDALGLALRLYLQVEIEPSTHAQPELSLTGEGSSQLPSDAGNLIFRVMRRAFELGGIKDPAVSMQVANQIPVARGLGSSAAAIVAGIACYEALTGYQLSPEKFFQCAFEFEKHADNLTAARFGGFTVSCVGDQEQVTFLRAEVSPEVKILLVVPEFQLQTEKARAAIPGTFSLKDAVFNVQRSSLTVASFLKGEFHLLHESLRDRLHQPFQAPLIPGFAEILEMQNAGIEGLWGICLSGAGPSILIFAESNMRGIYLRIEEVFNRHGIHARLLELEADNLGRTIE